MVDEDEAGLARAMTGEDLGICDLCGRPVLQASLVRLAGRPELAEPVEAVRICAECRTRTEHGEVPFDAEIAAGLQAAES